MSEVGYSGTKAAAVVGISYRQLDYWARTNLIRPSLTDATGSGSRRQYGYRDLLELRVIKSLLDVLLCDGDQLVDVLQRGQGVLNVLAIGGLKTDLDHQLVQLGEAAAPVVAARAV